MYLCKEYTETPLKVIGQTLGNRHHSTVIYGYNAIRDLMQSDQKVAKDVKELATMLGF